MHRHALLLCVLLVGLGPAAADTTAVVSPASEAAEGLDLHAVAELFRQSKDVEQFERKLNDADTGVNNLDLDEDGQVDFLRVVEEVEGETHVLILQAPLADQELQDVATIEIERTEDDVYDFQVRGSVLLYGPNYYVVPPPGVYVATWPVVTWIYRPVYRPYRSVWYAGHWPGWWHPRPRVSVSVYHRHTARWTRTTNFSVTTTGRVRSARRVYVTPTNSPTATRHVTRATSADGTKQGRAVTRTATDPAGKTTTVKHRAGKVTDPATGKTKTVHRAGVSTTDPTTGKTRRAATQTTKKKDPASGKASKTSKAVKAKKNDKASKTKKKGKASKAKKGGKAGGRGKKKGGKRAA